MWFCRGDEREEGWTGRRDRLENTQTWGLQALLLVLMSTSTPSFTVRGQSHISCLTAAFLNLFFMLSPHPRSLFKLSFLILLPMKF